LLLIINDPEIKQLFTSTTKTALVHGDLIIHNLLTDGKKLASFGDLDYDLSRLLYYHECAKAYQEQGIDQTFEADYMNKLIVAISKSNLIEDRRLFQNKYRFMRAIFYLNAFYWAVNSREPKKNVNEIIVQWDKKSGTKYLRT